MENYIRNNYYIPLGLKDFSVTAISKNSIVAVDRGTVFSVKKNIICFEVETLQGERIGWFDMNLKWNRINNDIVLSMSTIGRLKKAIRKYL